MHKLLQLHRRKSMYMSQHKISDRIARHPGQQGARHSAGNQAEVDKFATGKNSHGKRTRTSSGSSNESAPRPTRLRSWPRYLCMTGLDNKFKSLSAITISRTLASLLGQTENTRRLQDGSLLIHVCSSDQATTLEGLTEFADVPVKVSAHRTLNSCKGVVYSHESGLSPDAELTDWLVDYGVTNFHRIPTKSAPCELLILTFAGTVLPGRVPIGFEWCRVRPYIPNPRRCFNCQRFGHMSKFCNRRPACARCGSESHTHSRDLPCSLMAQCVNCGAAHAAYDKSCPKWILEKEVQRLKVTKDISFPEARRLAENSNGPVTYASVASYPTPTVRTTPRKRLNLDPDFHYSNACTLTSPALPDKPSAADDESATMNTTMDTSSNADSTETHDDDAAKTDIAVKDVAESSVSSVPSNGNPSAFAFSTACTPTSSVVPDKSSNADGSAKGNKIMASDSFAVSIDEDNEETGLSVPEYLMYVLDNPTDDFSSDRDFIVHCQLKPTLDVLMRHGLIRAHRLFSERVKMPYHSWPSDQFTSASDLKRVIGPYHFSDEHCKVLLLLVMHDMFSVALKLAKCWRTK